MKRWKIAVGMTVPLGLAAAVLGTALTANQNVDRYASDEMITAGAAADAHVYKGGFVGLDPAGRAKAFAAGDRLIGVAYSEADNTDGAAGAIDVAARRGDYVLTLSGVAADDLLAPVYATDDATIALTGHPDAYVGRIIGVHDTNKARVRFEPGALPPNGIGSIVLQLTGHETWTATGATAGDELVGAFEIETILGPGMAPNDAEDGWIVMAFDATAEVALASVRTPHDILPVDKGITFEVELVVSDIGDASAIDLDFGLGTALTTDSEASIDHAAMVNLACFHLDGASDNLLAQSDNDATDVAAVDTEVDNDSTTDVAKKFKIVVRPTGAVEFWIAGARVLSSTTFAVASTANLAAFINLEKTSDNTTAEVKFRNLVVKAGAGA